MASQVSTITPGTPISSDVLGEHAQAINAMYSEVFGRTASVTIERDRSSSNVRVTELQAFAKKVDLTVSNLAANTAFSVQVSFPAFAAPPIAVATKAIGAETDRVALSADVSVLAVTNQSVRIAVSFPQPVSAAVSLSVNLIALGVAPALAQ